LRRGYPFVGSSLGGHAGSTITQTVGGIRAQRPSRDVLPGVTGRASKIASGRTSSRFGCELLAPCVMLQLQSDRPFMVLYSALRLLELATA